MFTNKALIARAATAVMGPPMSDPITSLTSVVAEWAGDDISGTNGDVIGSWPARKGGVPWTQSVGANKPNLVTNAVGTHRGLRGTISGATEMTANIASLFTGTAATAYVVARLNSNDRYSLLNCGDNASWWRYYGSGNAYCGLFRTSRINNFPATPTGDGALHLFVVKSSNSSWSMEVDHVLFTDTNSEINNQHSTNQDPYCLFWDRSTTHSEVDFIHIVMCNELTSTDDDATIKAAILSRYGI